MMAQKDSLRSMKYDRDNTTRLYIKLNKTHDADIIDRLDSVENKQGYVKELIRKDIRGENNGRTKAKGVTGDG